MALITPAWGQHNAGQPGGAPGHSARAARLALAASTNHTPGRISGMAVTESNPVGMSVDVSAGLCVVPVTSQAADGSWPAQNDTAVTLTIGAADPTNPRIDIVCVQVKDSNLDGTAISPSNDVVQFAVVAGTPAPSPTAPATPANSLLLAAVTVPAAAATIVNANITATTSLLAPLPVRRRFVGQAAPALSGQLGGLHWDPSKNRLLAETAAGWKIVGGELPIVSRTRNTAIPANGTITVIGMNGGAPVTIVDTDGIISGVALVIPAGLGGDWEVGVEGAWAANTTGQREVRIAITNNAVTGERQHISTVGNGVGRAGGQRAVKQVRLQAGATLTFEAFQNSGGALDLLFPHMWARMVNHLPGF
jgi:hypothetical protein